MVIFDGCGRWPRSHENVVQNPGFDMSPWDTGWVIDTASYAYSSNNGPASAMVEYRSDTGGSPPNSLFLSPAGSAGCAGGGGCGLNIGGYGVVSQIFNEIENCSIKVYVKFRLFVNEYYYFPYDACKAAIEVLKNGQWITIWEVFLEHPGDTAQLIWEEVATYIDTSVSGIRFRSRLYYDHSYADGIYGHANFWIDDIYVGGDRS